jgi:peptidoglycan-N-acetylglucosamine deacetylase
LDIREIKKREVSFIKKLYQNLYYRFWNCLLQGSETGFPESFRGKRNLFIYFDYEREFGGHSTLINDDDIKKLATLLKEKNLRTTWFTVGKIFAKYPDSIREIINNGHEIGSHTYSHIPPFNSSGEQINDDFHSFHEMSDKIVPVRGFHSPNGRWSAKILKHLYVHNYNYDVISWDRKKPCRPFIVRTGRGKSLIRFQTVGDDWTLYRSKKDKNEVFSYFNTQLDKLDNEDIGGIGFHPWILFSETAILEGFVKFLDSLISRNDLNIGSALSFAELINAHK